MPGGHKLGMTSQFMRLVVRPAGDVDRLIDGMEDYARQSGGTPYASEPAVETGYGRRWNLEDEPDKPHRVPGPTGVRLLNVRGLQRRPHLRRLHRQREHREVVRDGVVVLFR
jgi:hypothetical protein